MEAEEKRRTENERRQREQEEREQEDQMRKLEEEMKIKRFEIKRENLQRQLNSEQATALPDVMIMSVQMEEMRKEFELWERERRTWWEQRNEEEKQRRFEEQKRQQKYEEERQKFERDCQTYQVMRRDEEMKLREQEELLLKKHHQEMERITREHVAEAREQALRSNQFIESSSHLVEEMNRRDMELVQQTVTGHKGAVIYFPTFCPSSTGLLQGNEISDWALENISSFGAQETDNMAEAAFADFRIVMIGKNLEEKAKLGTFITAKSIVPYGKLSKQSSVFFGQWRRKAVTIYNTTDLFSADETHMREEVNHLLSVCAPGPNAFLLLVDPSEFTQTDSDKLRSILGGFGDDAHKYSTLILTKGDISWNTPFNALKKDCGQRLLRLDYGLLQENLMDNIQSMVDDYVEGIHTFMLVQPVGPLNLEDKQELDAIRRAFTSKMDIFKMILFTVDSESMALAVARANYESKKQEEQIRRKELEQEFIAVEESYLHQMEAIHQKSFEDARRQAVVCNDFQTKYTKELTGQELETQMALVKVQQRVDDAVILRHLQKSKLHLKDYNLMKVRQGKEIRELLQQQVMHDPDYVMRGVDALRKQHDEEVHDWIQEKVKEAANNNACAIL
uniref:AIG1-type G domain-containing protein n=1 Tax=Knipowitschia caucasica TaxID=637954 RepID=A0AAV2MPB7_KNICA